MVCPEQILNHTLKKFCHYVTSNDRDRHFLSILISLPLFLPRKIRFHKSIQYHTITLIKPTQKKLWIYTPSKKSIPPSPFDVYWKPISFMDLLGKTVSNDHLAKKVKRLFPHATFTLPKLFIRLINHTIWHIIYTPLIVGFYFIKYSYGGVFFSK